MQSQHSPSSLAHLQVTESRPSRPLTSSTRQTNQQDSPLLAWSAGFRHPNSAFTKKSRRKPTFNPAVIPVVIQGASVASVGALARHQLRSHQSSSAGQASSLRDSANKTSRFQPAAVYNSRHAIVLPTPRRSGPNPALELTCYGRQPCPGGNALRAFCATMPMPPAVARSSALR